jgi:hypothetical protein
VPLRAATELDSSKPRNLELQLLDHQPRQQHFGAALF